MDEEDTVIFSLGHVFIFSPPSLESEVEVSEPVKVYSNGDVKSEISFTDAMQVSITIVSLRLL